MITYNKLINIIVFYIFTQNWKFENIDYLKEKYNRIFNTYPDVIYDDHDFNNQFSEYKKLWKLSDVDEDDVKILNFCYNISKFKKSESLNPKDFVNLYNSFFNSYNSINKKNQIKLLHVNLREVIKNYTDGFDIFKFLYIRQKLTLNEK